jgi:hypothetical protein
MMYTNTLDVYCTYTVRREILGVNFILTVLIDVLGNTKAKREVCIGVL